MQGYLFVVFLFPKMNLRALYAKVLRQFDVIQIY